MIKIYVNRFIKTSKTKSFEDSTLNLITTVIKKEYPKLNANILLPVVFASVTESTVTMSIKKLKKKNFIVKSNRTILEYLSKIESNTVELIAIKIRTILFKIARRYGFFKRRVVVSIDFHDKPFYGKKDTFGTVGTKRKLGTNFAYSYITICICEEGIRFNLATIPVTKQKLKKTLIERLITEARKHVSIGLILLDRAFNGVETSRLIDDKHAYYVMPLIDNKKIARVCKTTRKLVVLPYIYYENRSKEYRKEIRVIVDNRNNKNHLFTTNIKGNNRALLSTIIYIYRKRWGIETGYRVSGNFYAWTTSVKFNTRTFLGLLSFLMQDFWVLYNFILRKGNKKQQPRKTLLKKCKSIVRFLKKSAQDIRFYWRPEYEVELFKEDIADCIKKKLT
ncbi:MAG: transposase [Nanoarchaeota archaeon]|nr:transposase [Nanoarchaeota archaeon]